MFVWKNPVTPGLFMSSIAIQMRHTTKILPLKSQREITLSPFKAMTADRFRRFFTLSCAELDEIRITYANLVPPIVLFLAKHPAVSDFNLSSLQTLVSAAAPLGLGVTREVESRLNVNLLQAYGLTECSPLTHYDEVPHKRGTIGRLIPNTQAKVIHPVSGETLGVGESGEILIRGPQVMVGYLKNQEATNETVAPAELEALLCTHPHIQDAAVVGLPIGEEVGEVPKAFVVATPGAKVTEQDVHDFVNKNVAPYKKLRGGVEFIDQVPKTASGKILRRTLKQF
ncbi:4CL1-like protein [Mya arenaria]|uniref:4CL1-like protein n=1 Tax=Mya arenaria TaxID=6604 RepID=A0ABY7DVS0_MYAAR|nr:4CL1-like protein [Mya arenaria]